MIFVTVGHQTPFDRLIRLVDRWAGQCRAPVFAQIGESRYRPENITTTKFLSPQEFNARLDACTAVVAHAGTGTIMQSLLKQKPILVLPRLTRNGETRNDHQVSTARYFADTGQLLAAYDDGEFLSLLDNVTTFRSSRALVADCASDQLLACLRTFLNPYPLPETSTPDQPAFDDTNDRLRAIGTN